MCKNTNNHCFLLFVSRVTHSSVFPGTPATALPEKSRHPQPPPLRLRPRDPRASTPVRELSPSI